ncbi:hypothetical protein [Luteolibacter sp. AS25]|uniref:hypothetical protein n=1 Tax=Luteolibacter sp. AS25 TaxID=3135776 RepID=UPI00398A85ED
MFVTCPHLDRFLTLISIIATASTLNAAVVVTEDFDNMTFGELNGQSGTFGISGNWKAQTAITEIVSTPADFGVTVATGETIKAAGKSLQLTGNSSSAISVDLTTIQTNDFYVSFLVKMEAGSIGTNDFATLWFGEGSHIGAPAVGIKAQLGVNNTDFMGRITGNREAYAPEQLVVGESYYLVAKVSKADGSSTYNQLDFWVNPGSGDFATPEGTSTGNISFDEFKTIGIRSVNLDSDDVLLFDNFKVTTEWSDLFIPEPSITLLAGITGTILIFRRKRPYALLRAR